MSRFLMFPAGRRAKWVVFAVWIVAVLGMGAANLPGKFSDAEKNESTSFLPGDAESTKALAVTKQLQRGEQAPTVIVYHRDGGLTAQDKAKIEQDIDRLNGLRFPNATPFGNPAGRSAGTPYQLAPDGRTAIIANSLRSTGESADILDPVDAYRKAVSDPGG